ncbi:Beta-lactamase [Alteripontixanthobacter maritimus]|uniref:Beta-lactamase n=1 Tax=Alteripontixanthobacter maritimus TaxID=2161824 RepID=A0A369QC50_9SPHN|nr:alpha/beta hydrolase [Alteripontixanthobacter maritimus]RDC60816.1 Beta-lactamase [Alteripontixanthobacter maritimus]
MRGVVALFLALATLFAAPLSAQTVQSRMVVTTTIVEEWVEASPSQTASANRLVSAHSIDVPEGIASYGPFRVLDDSRAALVDATNTGSPAHFAAMLAAHPGIETLQLVECPGTDDDRANLALGRMIRSAGLATHVPRGGSVRSGAVELFWAGATRRVDEGAEFAVHSWLDEDGLQADDFAATAPENSMYLNYYIEMGMAAPDARAFYDLTNSVPHEQALWLTARDIRGWMKDSAGDAVRVAQPSDQPMPQIAYALLDSGSEPL